VRWLKRKVKSSATAASLPCHCIAQRANSSRVEVNRFSVNSPVSLSTTAAWKPVDIERCVQHVPEPPFWQKLGREVNRGPWRPPS
jgi:hypothetical protein